MITIKYLDLKTKCIYKKKLHNHIDYYKILNLLEKNKQRYIILEN